MRRTRIGFWILIAVFSMSALQLPAGRQARIIRIRAERYHFTPSEIRLTLGEEVELRLKSDDTAHGFRIVGPDTNIVIPKRGQGEASIRFVAKTAGRFEFECSQMCGAGHSFMRGVIVVKAAEMERSAR